MNTTTLADFWLPDSNEDIGDPRPGIWHELITRNVTIAEPFEVEKNTKCPPSFLGVSAGWYHTIDHGPQTEEIFRDDLQGAIIRFADLIAEKYNPFEPILFYRPAVASYGVSPYSFEGGDMPFDVRIIGMVEQSIPFDVDGERRWAPGVKWWLSTMIVPNEKRDAEVHVGYDWGANYD